MIKSTYHELKEQALQANLEIPRRGLAIYTFGNVSAFDADRAVFAIKPSGIAYESLSAADMVVLDVDGNVVEGHLRPSSDTKTHAALYRAFHALGIGGIVHTHSTYATAWAARREPIPCVLTMVADEFGGEIPVGPFALIGDDSIGRGIVETLRGSRSRAVLMAGHGPFTVGRDARDAVKAAVMLEDVARTVHVSRQLGTPEPLAATDVDALFDRYQNVYGQQGEPQ
jgi:L-ribulose-5-phosphate 4-epimerase